MSWSLKYYASSLSLKLSRSIAHHLSAARAESQVASHGFARTRHQRIALQIVSSTGSYLESELSTVLPNVHRGCSLPYFFSSAEAPLCG